MLTSKDNYGGLLFTRAFLSVCNYFGEFCLEVFARSVDFAACGGTTFIAGW